MARGCVGALLLRGDVPRILLGKRAVNRAYYPGVWDLPGGHCEPGEPVEQALIRELREELGVTPTAWNALDVIRSEMPQEDEALVLHFYGVTAWTGTPHNRLPEEHERVAWFTVDDACRLELAHPTYPVLFRRLTSLAG